jgi:hypothetical protein
LIQNNAKMGLPRGNMIVVVVVVIVVVIVVVPCIYARILFVNLWRIYISEPPVCESIA